MINIASLYRSVEGTKEPIELRFERNSFPQLSLKNDIECKGELLRLGHAILLGIHELSTTVLTPCVLCGKSLEIPLLIGKSEWFFYEPKYVDQSDPFDAMTINLKSFTLDPREVIRQEIILNWPDQAHCEPRCTEYETAEAKPEGIKALKALRDLVDE